MEDNCIKLPYAKIGIEITRKCNLKCRHCMRGEAENHTISKIVIDKFLDEILLMDKMILTGGEPFLEPEAIKYLFDRIIHKRIPILSFSCVTNGTIKDKSIAESWNNLSEYIYNNFGGSLNKKSARMIGQIVVSRDDYHDNDPMDTVKFYRKYLNDHCITRAEKPKKDEKIYMLGRALSDERLVKSKNVRYRVCPYRLEMGNDRILTCIMVGYDGKIMIGEDSSYEQQDRVNYGNIQKHHIYELITKGFLEEPFTMKEAELYNYFYTKLKTEDFDEYYTKEYYECILQYFNVVWSIREALRISFPFLNYEEIVEAAYDDMNCNLRQSNTDPEILRIDTFDRYHKTIEESQIKCNRIKNRALLGNYNILLANKFPIRQVPVKAWQ